jgi:tripartite-type tricarboxylate transporter receptor subunit TctC
MKRRSILAGLGASAVAAPLASPALAQAYPNKPITIVVPFAAGGPTDLMARIVTERMSKELGGQTFVIDNTTGAAGSIGVGKVARAAPDGYTISIGHLGTHVANGVIYKNLNYDMLTDLVPVALLPANPLLVVTSTQVPAKDLKEVVAYIAQNQDKVSGGTAGLGSGSHLGALAFFAATKTKYQMVPYRGTGPAVQDLIANQIQIMVDQSSNSLPHVRSGKLKAYAVTAKERSKAAPEIPTCAEAGFPMEVAIWHGLWAPKGTPADIVAKLNAAAIATLQDPAVRSKMEDLGQELPTPAQMAPAAFAAFHAAEFAKWKPLLADVKVE